MKTVCFLLFALVLNGCTKDDQCIDTIIGDYYGTLYTNSNSFQGEIYISKDASGGSNLFITDNMINSLFVGYKGILSSDCSRITVPDQNITLPDGETGVIGGVFDIYGTSVNGSLILTTTMTANLTYVLTKM